MVDKLEAVKVTMNDRLLAAFIQDDETLTFEQAAAAIARYRATPATDARERVKVLEEALEPFARTDVLERYHFERARTALGNKEAGHGG